MVSYSLKRHSGKFLTKNYRVRCLNTSGYGFRDFWVVAAKNRGFYKSRNVFNGHDYCKTFRLWPEQAIKKDPTLKPLIWEKL